MTKVCFITWTWCCIIGLATGNVLAQDAAQRPNPAPNFQIVRVRIGEVTGPFGITAGKTALGTVQLSGGKATLTISSLAVGSTKVTVTAAHTD
jgi:hypothetical protein